MMSVAKGIAAASAVIAMMAISTVAQAETVSAASRLALNTPVSAAQLPVGARVGAKHSSENKAVGTGVVLGVLAAAAAAGGIAAAASSGHHHHNTVSP